MVCRILSLTASHSKFHHCLRLLRHHHPHPRILHRLKQSLVKKKMNKHRLLLLHVTTSLLLLTHPLILHPPVPNGLLLWPPPPPPPLPLPPLQPSTLPQNFLFSDNFHRKWCTLYCPSYPWTAWLTSLWWTRDGLEVNHCVCVVSVWVCVCPCKPPLHTFPHHIPILSLCFVSCFFFLSFFFFISSTLGYTLARNL